MTDEIYAVFKERDLAVQRDAIASALEDPAAGRENAEWASKHLHPETLLSREEWTLYVFPWLTKLNLVYANERGTNRYSKLEISGALNPLLRDPDLPATRPLLEDDIRSAIESLEASTVAIQKQRETLSLQCKALKKQLRRQEGLDQEKSRDLSRLRKKHEAGRQNTTIAVITLPLTDSGT